MPKAKISDVFNVTKLFLGGLVDDVKQGLANTKESTEQKIDVEMEKRFNKRGKIVVPSDTYIVK